MVFRWRTQPWKAICIAYTLSTLFFIRLPFWLVWYLPRFLRQRPSWSYRKTVTIAIFRNLATLPYKIGVGPLSIPGLRPHDGAFVSIEGVPDLVLGEIKEKAERAGISAIQVGGWWYGDGVKTGEFESRAIHGERVVMHLHGGAYVLGSANPSDVTANISRGLLHHARDSILRTFSVEYRLARSAPYPPSGQFPAALIDALAGYNYLVKVIGFEPENIIVAGDSAGGNLALALTRYLVTNKIPDLAPPGGLLLFSPWCDLAVTHRGPTTSGGVNRGVDYLGEWRNGLGEWAVQSLLHRHPQSEVHDPYISPASLGIPKGNIEGLFKDYPKTFILSGDAERILDEIRTLKSRMENDIGNKIVFYYEGKEAVHDFCVFPWHEPERSEALGLVASWIKAL